MNMKISDTVLFLSEDNDGMQKTILEAGLSIYDKIDALNGINNLQKMITDQGNLTFIRKELLKMTTNMGYPFFIILDLRIVTGLKDDHDRIKILRTIIISYIIMMQGKSFKNMSCNLFILADQGDYEKLQNLIKNPAIILDTVKTNNEQINSLIKSFRQDTNKFNQSFNIVFSNKNFSSFQKNSELSIFINRIKIKNKLRPRITEPGENASTNKAKNDPASIIFRIDDSVIIDGSISDSISSEYSKFTDREIYISGNFTGYTKLDVVERLTDFVKKGACEAYSFDKEEILYINLPDQCLMDSSIPVTLMQLIMKDFSDFKKVRIKTTMQNAKKFSQFEGHKMLEKYIIISSE